MEAEGIFISYRRSDLPHAAGRLSDALSREFGDRRIFRDIEDIEAGADFTVRLNTALASCKVMLVLMGNAWLQAPGSQARRLDNAEDWVRQEIASALRRNVRVIPVLLEQAQMPAETDLPDELKPLLRRQALLLSDGRWQSDVDHLIVTLRQFDAAEIASHPVSPVKKAADQAAEISKRVGAEAGKWARRLLLLGLGAMVLVTVLMLLLIRSCNSETPEVAGLWHSDTGAPFEFTRADQKGERAYTVQAVQRDLSRLNCTATPSFFGSLTMQCQVLKASVIDDRWTCDTLTVLESPLRISGSCKSQRDGRLTTLVLNRVDK
jgi:hypothetical protein